MPQYLVELLDRRVQQELDRVQEPDYSRLAAAPLRLEDDQRPPGCRTLRGLDGWRVRVGDWRVIYQIDDSRRLVTIVAVRRRREDTYR